MQRDNGAEDSKQSHKITKPEESSDRERSPREARAEHSMQRAVEAARQSAFTLNTVFEQMSDGVILCDTMGQPKFINPAARHLLGVDGEAANLQHLFAGTGDDALLVKADGSPFTNSSLPWQRACSEGLASRDEELRVRRPKGNEITISVDSTPLHNDKQELIGAVAVFRDVTENRRLIDELREANRRLEEFNRLKAEFVANMSHELRTPLTAIIGFTQLMEMRATNEHLPATFMDPIERVLRNSRHLLSLIDDVLDMSKIEAGRIAVHPETFDLVELVQAAFGELAGLAKRKGLEYRLNIKDEFPLAFNDPVRVRQILLNLLSNAIKFTPHGSIEAELERTDENEWQLTVRDTGVGIKKESLGFIFERFRQVDGSMTRREGGTGLGLSIVQQLVTLLGGRVWVDSEYGAGSTFTVRLPLFALSEKSLDSFAQQALEGRVNDSRSKDIEARGERGDDERSLMLVIEDDADARALLSETLERAGYRVVTATDGPTGLKMARELLPTAITLDIMMPSVDGWRVLQAMKADRRTAAIPVIVCSIVDNRPLGYRLGASDYLVKPIKQQDLIQALRNVGAGDEQSDRYVLVVDDERGVRELLVEALKKAGFNAQGAPTGEIALSLATERTPQAILCDLLMPGMSGFELIARLRTNEATAHTPIIVITSKDVTIEDRKLMRGQIADVIRKGDLLMPDLESRLRDTLEEIGVKPSDGEDTVS